ncbi:MAG: TfoX/Sxy family protein [Terrimesophilobacter sp.]
MQMPKPSDEDKAFFRSIVPDGPAVEVKPMFGNLGAFVHGNMFAGLFGPTVGVHLAEDDRAALEAIEGSGPFGPPERPMGGYVGLPASWADDPGKAKTWVAKAHDHVAALPPKVAKPKKQP